MEFYDLEEIKRTANCITVAKSMLGLQLNADNRCAATWRGGSNPTSVLITDKGFTDFGAKDNYEHKSGSVIDLTMAVEKLDIVQTAERLGQFLNLKKTSYIPDAPERKVVAEYIYNDINGKPLHKTIRYEPKDFSQSHFANGAWHSGLNGIELVPFNLPEVAKADSIIFVEGEKDALTAGKLGYTATTVSGGAEKWKPYYNQYFKGKHIIIIADNDDKGKAHAKKVSYELRNDAKSIKVLIPSNKPKGDLTDWVNDGGNKKQLDKMIKDTKPLELGAIEPPLTKRISSEIEKAKALNKEPFKNYRWVDLPQVDGNVKKVKVPRTMKELIHELFLRLLGFPRLLGDTLFDFDRDTHEINLLHNVNAFTGWISDKTGHPMDFITGSKFISTHELYEVLKLKTKKYDGLSYTAEYPQKPEKFYAVADMPEPSNDFMYFNKLIEFFNPYNSADKILIKAMFASAIYSPLGVDRPLWIIESFTDKKDTKLCETGKGIGKTSLVKMLAYLLGGYTFDSKQVMSTREEDYKNINSRGEILSRILSADGRMKKIVLIDNVTHYFESATFSEWITQASFSGRAKYGHGETTRPNDLTFLITSNSGTFGRDILDRSFIICLERPKQSVPGWEQSVMKFIDSHRHQIIADIIGYIKSNSNPDAEFGTRFKTWERDILMPITQNKELHEYVIEAEKTRHETADGDVAEGEDIEDFIENKLNAMGYLAHKNFYWISGTVIRTWCLQAIPNFGGRDGRHYKEKLRRMIQAGAIKRLAIPFDKYPHRSSHLGKPIKGLMWIPEGESWKQGKSVEAIIRNLN